MKTSGLTNTTNRRLFSRHLRSNALSFLVTALLIAGGTVGVVCILCFVNLVNGRWILTILLLTLLLIILAIRIFAAQRYEEFRKDAAENATDQNLLRELATLDQQDIVRIAAIKRLNDSKCLTEIALNDPVSVVREVAASRIDDPVSMETILRESKDSWIIFSILRSINQMNREQKAGIPRETRRAMRDFAAQHGLLEKQICSECFCGTVETRGRTEHMVEYEYCSTDTVVIGYEGDVTITDYYCSSCGRESMKDFSVTLANLLSE